MTKAFNTGKVKIGEAYVPRQRLEVSKDAFDLQTQLLGGRRPRSVDWDGISIVVTLAILVAGGLAKFWGFV